MIYLAQTDTTAGFLSKDKKTLNKIKARALNQPCLITTARFCELKNLARVPNSFKNHIRKAKKTSFIYPNGRAIRVVLHSKHRNFLLENGWFYSSSANLHGEKFNAQKAKTLVKEAGGILIDEQIFEGKASSIFKLSRTRKLKKRT